MNDHLGLFDRHGDDETGELNLTELRAALTQTARRPRPPPAAGAGSAARREQRVARQKAAKRRKRRVRHSIIALLVLAVIAGAVFVGFKIWRKDSTAIPDFTGTGTTETVVRVGSGDTLTDIAETLADDERGRLAGGLRQRGHRQFRRQPRSRPASTRSGCMLRPPPPSPP